jgi:hypothetical protein
MKNPKSYLTTLIALTIAVLPAVLQTGCRGDVGWARMDGAMGRQSPSRLDQSGGLELLNSTSLARADMAMQEEAPAVACSPKTYR